MYVNKAVLPAFQKATLPLYIGQMLGSLANKVRSLFNAGEQGVWYDPSDLSTLFQDSAGTTPVTAVEQPVGLMLDKSRGLVRGLENNVDPSFEDETKWVLTNPTSGGVTINNGKLNLISLDGTYANACPALTINIIAGRWYEYVLDVETCTGNVTVSIGGVQGAVFTGGGVKRGLLYATSTSMEGVKRAGGACNAVINSFSIRELSGNHAYQATAASRPVVSARVNLLTKSEDFTAAVWSKDGSTAVSTLLTEDTSNTQHRIYQFINTPANVPITLSSLVSRVSGTRFAMLRLPSASGSAWVSYNFDTGAVLGGTSGSTWTVLTATASEKVLGQSARVQLTAVSTEISSSAMLQLANAASPVTYIGDGVSSVNFTEVQCEVGTTASRYQRVNTATDYDTAGFPVYLKFDGVDDSLATGNINFTSTDKMTVWAGVRKLSDAASGSLIKLGSSGGIIAGVAGELDISAPPNNGLARYGFSSFGNTARMFIANASPFTLGAGPKHILSCMFNNALAPDSVNAIKPRVNGATFTVTNDGVGATAAPGNFGNAPLKIGNVYNGNLYGLIVRGALTTDVAPTERYLANKTGVTLP